MWSRTPAHEDEAAPATPSQHPWTRTLADHVLWWPVLLIASGVWFLFGMRLMSRFGPDALGPAAGLMAAAAVGISLWLWSARDSHRESLEAGVCPRCAASISRYEEVPRPGALARGLEGWRCERCGLEEARPLTPERDAS